MSLVDGFLLPGEVYPLLASRLRTLLFQTNALRASLTGTVLRLTNIVVLYGDSDEKDNARVGE